MTEHHSWNANFIHVRMRQIFHKSLSILQHAKDWTTVVVIEEATFDVLLSQKPSIVQIESSLFSVSQVTWG